MEKWVKRHKQVSLYAGQKKKLKYLRELIDKAQRNQGKQDLQLFDLHAETIASTKGSLPINSKELNTRVHIKSTKKASGTARINFIYNLKYQPPMPVRQVVFA